MRTDVPGPALLSSITQGNSAKGPVSSSTPPPGSAFSQFAAFSSAPSGSQSSTPGPTHSAFAPPPSKPASTDPFAALASPSFPSKSPSQVPAAAKNDDDEWSFSSALPPEAPVQPREHKVMVHSTNIKIDMLANRITSSATAINLLFAFTNNSAQPVSELHFQLAVTKVCF